MAPPRRTALAGQSTQPHRTTTSARRRRSDQPAAPASSDGDDVNGDAGGLSKVCAASLVALAHPHAQPCASGILPTPTMTTNAPILPFPAQPRTARRGDQRRCGHAPLRVVRPHCRCHVTTRTPPPPTTCRKTNNDNNVSGDNGKIDDDNNAQPRLLRSRPSPCRGMCHCCALPSLVAHRMHPPQLPWRRRRRDTTLYPPVGTCRRPPPVFPC